MASLAWENLKRNSGIAFLLILLLKLITQLLLFSKHSPVEAFRAPQSCCRTALNRFLSEKAFHVRETTQTVPSFLIDKCSKDTEMRSLNSLIQLSLMKRKRNPLAATTHTKNRKQESTLKLDSFFLGKYYAEWTIRNIREKASWRWQEMHSPPLRTSQFAIMGTIKNFQLKFWPHGDGSSKKGYVALLLHQTEHWQRLETDIFLFVDKFERGPFQFGSPEYYEAGHSICKLEDLDLSNDELKVGMRISPIHSN